MTDIQFSEFPKIPRLFRDMTITEKIDGTNAAVGIVQGRTDKGPRRAEVKVANEWYTVYAQSRKRLINPDVDNFGFACWVWTNAAELVKILGPGLHFGEWWGQGIQRGYDLDHRRFSLFNTHRWGWLDIPEARAAHEAPDQLHVVPVIAKYAFDTDVIRDSLNVLKDKGSYAAPGFMNPEGVCVYHSAGNHIHKVTFDMDMHKSELELAA